MSYHIDLQLVSNDELPVDENSLITWAQLPLMGHMNSAELTLRVVDKEEIQQLNHLYRKQDKATNVLAFPSTIPDNIKLDYPLLGDVIICPAVLKTESMELDKPLIAHWAHIVIHGVLHLLGYDHIEEADARVMQEQEVKLLVQLGFANPYHTTEDKHFEQRG
ncbi:rRNA maturation RNase YbeY [Legionella jamestowniensis]|uniref:Endoribonuclease YbeY n=1 Tax=Legionella jamestowniensis TaxID=455 RepID=A0A0W0UPH6_9GAMM|nr:rRNA maturation RNase YbeY [Legionella jamestowniensis]KTD09542.1 metal-dependent hydrolase [Legionella jamestowniensis]OCH98714.1 rRNA maturation RNase YbeY [Legionella jamestowniensis]SFL90907.1 probable rRNA maturation factor [Legionella jamestowniensis DSM 19215]